MVREVELRVVAEERRAGAELRGRPCTAGTRNSKGSTVLEIIIDGQSYKIPAIGSLEIPGLVKLQDAIEIRTTNGIKVIGLRVTLLDGTGAVVDLGVASLGIRPGVRPGS